MRTQWIQRLKKYTVVLLAGVALPVLAFASNSVGTAVSDTVITGKVKSSLAMNEITHAQDISVKTDNGVVFLSGTAKSETEAAQAIEIAESTADVKRVDASQLHVTQTNHPISDAYITAKIKGIFLRNNLTSGTQNVPLVDVKVETQDGMVLLSGFVENRAQAEKLVKLAKSIDGVENVKSTLEIKKQ